MSDKCALSPCEPARMHYCGTVDHISCFRVHFLLTGDQSIQLFAREGVPGAEYTLTIITTDLYL